jgi:hypothetical protein
MFRKPCDLCQRHWTLRTSVKEQNAWKYGCTEGMYCQKWKVIMCEVAAMMGISFLSVQSILKELWMCVTLLPNFAPQSSLLICVNWQKKKTVFTPPLHSLDFPSCDFFLLPKLKVMLKGRRFNDITMIQTNLWDAHAEFQTVCYTVCFNSSMVPVLIMKAPRKLLGREQYWFEGKYCCYGKISPVWSLCDDPVYLLQEIVNAEHSRKSLLLISYESDLLLCLAYPPVVVALKWSFWDSCFSSVLCEFIT